MYGMYPVSIALIPKAAGIVMIRKDDRSVDRVNRGEWEKNQVLYSYTKH